MRDRTFVYGDEWNPGARGVLEHFYQIGDKYFLVCAAGYNTLVDGRRYRIYYPPDATTRRVQALSPMVNIEPLPDLPAP